MFTKDSVFINLEKYIDYIAVAPHRVYSESGYNVIPYNISTTRANMMMLRLV